jgi:hypothetical protein
MRQPARPHGKFIPVFADAGSPLTCFGVAGTATRVYFLDARKDVYEVAWENGWVTSNLTAAAKAPAAGMFSGLTCFGVGGTATRVYYVDANGDVYELAWENGWVATNVTAKAGAPPADGGNNLTCFGVGGTDSRIYYTDLVGAVGSVYELAWVNSGWVATNVTAEARAASVYRGTPLTCFGVGGTASRIYYLDNDAHVQELAWENGWMATDVTAQAGAPAASHDSALTCFGVGGTATRVYYVEPNRSHMYELAWENGWVATDVTAAAGASAATHNALSCFGVGGVASRIYYLVYNNADQDVYEMAWENGWVSTNLTAKANARTASNSSAVTCFGVGGTATRVYYVDGTGPIGSVNNVLPSGLVNELAWENGWVWSVT